MNKKTLAYVILGGAAVLLLTRRGNAQVPPRNINVTPPPPPPPSNNANAWAMWAQTIMQAYGNVAALWQPGGPFYRNNISDQQAQWIAQGVANAGWDASDWLAQTGN